MKTNVFMTIIRDMCSRKYLFWLHIWNTDFGRNFVCVSLFFVLWCSFSTCHIEGDWRVYNGESFIYLGHFNKNIDHKTVLTTVKIKLGLLYWKTFKCARILFAFQRPISISSSSVCIYFSLYRRNRKFTNANALTKHRESNDFDG